MTSRFLIQSGEFQETRVQETPSNMSGKSFIQVHASRQLLQQKELFNCSVGRSCAATTLRSWKTDANKTINSKKICKSTFISLTMPKDLFRKLHETMNSCQLEKKSSIK